MQAEILIVWPDAEAAEALGTAIGEAGVDARIRTLDALPEWGELWARLEAAQGRIRTVVVGMGADERAEQILRELSQVSLPVAPVAAARGLDARLVRDALRAGAVEFLTYPFDSGDLRKSIGRLVAPERSQVQGERLSFLPARANDGASMLAMHVAHALSREREGSCLLADLDAECGATAFRLGLNPSYTLADAVLRLDALDDLWERIACDWQGVHVLPGPDMDGALTSEDHLRLAAVVESACRTYEHVVLDLPACLTEGIELALVDCQTINMVCTPDFTSLHLARRKTRRLLELGKRPEAIRLILNRDGSNKEIRAQEVEKIVGLPIASTLPNDFSAVSRAALEGKLVPPDSGLGRALKGFTHDLLGIADESSGKSGGWGRLLRLS